MEPISNVDQVVLLLRQRLAERSRSGSPAAPAQKRSATDAAPSGVDSVRALASVEGIDERQLKRALVQNLLAEQFGPDLINDAKFQQIVDRVAETIEGEDGSSKLLSRAIHELRASAR
jgi:hypothetical protein